MKDTIGSGAFSKVKKVLTLTKDGDRHYAAKIIKKHVLVKQRAVRYNEKGEPVMLNNLDKIYEEIDVWMKLSDDGLIRLYEVIDDENYRKLFMIMELANLGQIMKYDEEELTYKRNDEIFEKIKLILSKKNDLTTTDVKNEEIIELVGKFIFKQLIDAIVYLHSNMVVHRDIKPDNILASTHENDIKIKLCDFTVANQLSSHDQKCYDYEGTPLFTSPEVSFCLNEGYDPKPNDVWSLGCCIYTYVMEKLPFTGESDIEVQIATKDKELELEDWISEPLKELLKNLLSKDPHQRFKIEEIKQHKWFDI